MNPSKTRFIPFAIAAILFLILLAMVIFLFVSNISPTDQEPNQSFISPTSAPDNQQTHPPAVNDVPTLAPQQGGGIDLNSSVIQASSTEIKKITSYLPYEQDAVLSTGESVSILIPAADLQENTWTMNAQIFGINYNTSPDQPDYEVTKTSFKEAVGILFSWIRQQGANPDKIIFIWGDKKYIQDQAEAWLKE